MPSFATLLFIGNLLGPGGPPRLISTLPIAHQILEEAPTSIRLGFNAAVRADSATITILSRDSVELLRLPARAVPTGPEIIEAIIPHKLLGGHYLVRWRTRAGSGELLEGIFVFIIDIPE